MSGERKGAWDGNRQLLPDMEGEVESHAHNDCVPGPIFSYEQATLPETASESEACIFTQYNLLRKELLLPECFYFQRGILKKDFVPWS
jgi:hypothetical protein